MKTNICLNMIVKDETPVLGRLFDSLKDIIDYYIIVDTGSSDGTPDFIRRKMSELDIRGEVYCHDWINFGHNRNQALQYVYKKNYQGWVLFIDADEEFACSDPEFFKSLKPGVTYQLEKHHNRMRYSLCNLVDVSRTKWEWRGVVHEYLQHISGPTEREKISAAWIIYHAGEGVRSRGISDAEKFLGDAALLEKECENDPGNTRNKFYLAQSYHHGGKLENAYQTYLERANMKGWDEENFIAQLRAARLAVILDKDAKEISAAFLKAHSMRPGRAEPLHDLAAFYRKNGQYRQAYTYAKKAAGLTRPDDILFVDQDIYDWRIQDELAVSAYWTGRYGESEKACKTILDRARQNLFSLDQDTITRISENLKFAATRIRANHDAPRTAANYRELLLGSGSRTNKDLLIDGIPENFVNLTRLDNNQDHKPDVLWDLTEHPLPFDDNSFDEIHAYEVLEHLAVQGDYHFFFAEFSEYHRILKPGGLFIASVPARDSIWAWGDPSHKRIIQPENLIFLDQDEYRRQVGITKMSDFRYLYSASFKNIYSHTDGTTFYFILKAEKTQKE